MTKLLTSNWMTLPVSVIVYLAATVAFWKTPRAAETPGRAGLHGQAGAVMGIQKSRGRPTPGRIEGGKKRGREKAAAAHRTRAAPRTPSGLKSPRPPNPCNRLQKEFDQNVLRVQEEETANLKKLAKVYSAMTPEGAARKFLRAWTMSRSRKSWSL